MSSKGRPAVIVSAARLKTNKQTLKENANLTYVTFILEYA